LFSVDDAAGIENAKTLRCWRLPLRGGRGSLKRDAIGLANDLHTHDVLVSIYFGEWRWEMGVAPVV
jgi:hypothetical protein